MKHVFLIIFFLWGASSVYSQTPDRWTMEECLQYAVEKSLSISSLEMKGRIVREDYRQAIARLFPSIGAYTSGQFNFGRGLDSDTNSYIDQNSFSNSYSVEASLNLFSGLSAVNRIRMEKINRANMKYQTEYQRDMVAYETMESFLQVQFDMAMVNLVSEQLAESELNLSQTRMMEELGLKGLPDVVEMEAKVAADRFALTKQNNKLAISLILLKEKMNYPLSETLDIEPYEAGVNDAGNIVSATEIYEAALSYNPKALAAESAYESVKMDRKIAVGSMLPTLYANGGWGTNFSRLMSSGSDYSSFSEQFRNKRGYYVGATLSIPVFSGLSRTSGMRKAKYSVQIAANDRDAELRSLYSDVEQAVTDAVGQADEYTQAVKQTSAMRLAHDLNKRKYEEGLISVLEFHTSANRLLEAMISEEQSLVKLYLKQKLVAYYAGIPLIEEQTNDE